jgi:hypothetical protein
MSDTAFWSLVSVVLFAGLVLVGRVVWLQYLEWREFERLIISDKE